MEQDCYNFDSREIGRRGVSVTVKSRPGAIEGGENKASRKAGRVPRIYRFFCKDVIFFGQSDFAANPIRSSKKTKGFVARLLDNDETDLRRSSPPRCLWAFMLSCLSLRYQQAKNVQGEGGV